MNRKEYPMYSGLMAYFPHALAAVAHCSYLGSKQHHPDEPLHWDRNKSSDHLDALMRHLTDAGKLDGDGLLHDIKVAWRALAHLETVLEKKQECGDGIKHYVGTVDDKGYVELKGVPEPESFWPALPDGMPKPDEGWLYVGKGWRNREAEQSDDIAMFLFEHWDTGAQGNHTDAHYAVRIGSPDFWKWIDFREKQLDSRKEKRDCSS